MTQLSFPALESLDWSKGDGLLPVVIQDAATRAVLMLGYMNREALAATQESGFVTFFSRSKGRLWRKGETSGHGLIVRDVRVDCDADALLILAEPQGPTCHTGTTSCFGEGLGAGILERLEQTIQKRRSATPEESYTAALFARGLPRMAQKVGEEGVEVALAGALRADNLTEEAADLLYHLIVLLVANDRGLADVFRVLEARAKA